MLTYRCLKYHEWRDRVFEAGERYVVPDGEAGRELYNYAEDLVQEGIFERIEGEWHPDEVKD